MSEKKRSKFKVPFKAKVALEAEAIRSDKTLKEIGNEFDEHPSHIDL